MPSASQPMCWLIWRLRIRGGFALALEVGFAHALGKEIILVNSIDPARHKYFAMVEAVATLVLPSLGAAIDYLSCRWQKGRI